MRAKKTLKELKKWLEDMQGLSESIATSSRLYGDEPERQRQEHYLIMLGATLCKIEQLKNEH